MNIKVHEDRKPVALYARVSSDRQDVDLSVSAQLRALRDHAQKNGYLVVREYVDEAESGRIADRPQFRRMLNDAGKPSSPFEEILVWKFSRFTRKREHAVAFKSMLRRRGVRVTSITEHSDDSPTGKLMEAIIESVDEFYSENLAQDVTRGMREAASRGFWVSGAIPYGYKKIKVKDGPKERPKLKPEPKTAVVVKRMFQMAEAGKSVLDITRTLNDEGVASAGGKLWSKTMVHYMLTNEVYTGTLVWGVSSKDKAPPIRVENAFPELVSMDTFKRVSRLMHSKAPTKSHPRRTSSSYLLSGLVKCGRCSKAMSGQEAKSGKFSYYVCQSLLKRGKGSCDAPRLNSRRFERLIVDTIRGRILIESNITKLVKMVDEEMDGVAHEQRRQLETIDSELAEVRRRLDRLFNLVETSDLDIADVTSRIREHREREERLADSAQKARLLLAERRIVLDDIKTITAYAKDMSAFLKTSQLTERRAFLKTFVKDVTVSPGMAIIHYTIPIVRNSHLPLSNAEEIRLLSPVLSTVRGGEPAGIRTQDTRIKSPML